MKKITATSVLTASTASFIPRNSSFNEKNEKGLDLNSSNHSQYYSKPSYIKKKHILKKNHASGKDADPGLPPPPPSSYKEPALEPQAPPSLPGQAPVDMNTQNTGQQAGQTQYGQQPGHPQYGQPAQSRYGQQPGYPQYGQPAQSRYGQQPGHPQYGQPAQSRYGQQPGHPQYGQAQPAWGTGKSFRMKGSDLKVDPPLPSNETIYESAPGSSAYFSKLFGKYDPNTEHRPTPSTERNVPIKLIEQGPELEKLLQVTLDKDDDSVEYLAQSPPASKVNAASTNKENINDDKEVSNAENIKDDEEVSNAENIKDDEEVSNKENENNEVSKSKKKDKVVEISIDRTNGRYWSLLQEENDLVDEMPIGLCQDLKKEGKCTNETYSWMTSMCQMSCNSDITLETLPKLDYLPTTKAQVQPGEDLGSLDDFTDMITGDSFPSILNHDNLYMDDYDDQDQSIDDNQEEKDEFKNALHLLQLKENKKDSSLKKHDDEYYDPYDEYSDPDDDYYDPDETKKKDKRTRTYDTRDGDVTRGTRNYDGQGDKGTRKYDPDDHYRQKNVNYAKPQEDTIGYLDNLSDEDVGEYWNDVPTGEGEDPDDDPDDLTYDKMGEESDDDTLENQIYDASKTYDEIHANPEVDKGWIHIGDDNISLENIMEQPTCKGYWCHLSVLKGGAPNIQCPDNKCHHALCCDEEPTCADFQCPQFMNNGHDYTGVRNINLQHKCGGDPYEAQKEMLFGDYCNPATCCEYIHTCDTFQCPVGWSSMVTIVQTTENLLTHSYEQEHTRHVKIDRSILKHHKQTREDILEKRISEFYKHRKLIISRQKLRKDTYSQKLQKQQKKKTYYDIKREREQWIQKYVNTKITKEEISREKTLERILEKKKVELSERKHVKIIQQEINKLKKQVIKETKKMRQHGARVKFKGTKTIKETDYDIKKKTYQIKALEDELRYIRDYGINQRIQRNYRGEVNMDIDQVQKKQIDIEKGKTGIIINENYNESDESSDKLVNQAASGSMTDDDTMSSNLKSQSAKDIDFEMENRVAKKKKSKNLSDKKEKDNKYSMKKKEEKNNSKSDNNYKKEMDSKFGLKKQKSKHKGQDFKNSEKNLKNSKKQYESERKIKFLQLDKPNGAAVRKGYTTNQNYNKKLNYANKAALSNTKKLGALNVKKRAKRKMVSKKEDQKIKQETLKKRALRDKSVESMNENEYTNQRKAGKGKQERTLSKNQFKDRKRKIDYDKAQMIKKKMNKDSKEYEKTKVVREQSLKLKMDAMRKLKGNIKINYSGKLDVQNKIQGLMKGHIKRAMIYKQLVGITRIKGKLREEVTSGKHYVQRILKARDAMRKLARIEKKKYLLTKKITTTQKIKKTTIQKQLEKLKLSQKGYRLKKVKTRWQKLFTKDTDYKRARHVITHRQRMLYKRQRENLLRTIRKEQIQDVIKHKTVRKKQTHTKEWKTLHRKIEHQKHISHKKWKEREIVRETKDLHNYIICGWGRAGHCNKNRCCHQLLQCSNYQCPAGYQHDPMNINQPCDAYPGNTPCSIDYCCVESALTCYDAQCPAGYILKSNARDIIAGKGPTAAHLPEKCCAKRLTCNDYKCPKYINDGQDFEGVRKINLNRFCGYGEDYDIEKNNITSESAFSQVAGNECGVAICCEYENTCDTFQCPRGSRPKSKKNTDSFLYMIQEESPRAPQFLQANEVSGPTVTWAKKYHDTFDAGYIDPVDDPNNYESDSDDDDEIDSESSQGISCGWGARSICTTEKCCHVTDYNHSGVQLNVNGAAGMDMLEQAVKTNEEPKLLEKKKIY